MSSTIDIPKFSSENAFKNIKKIKAIIGEDSFVIKNSKTWYLIDEIEEQNFKLYLQKEVASILHTRNFTDTTQKLIDMGIFTKEHYFSIRDGNDRKGNPIIRELWTTKGVDFLKELFVITREEEVFFIAHYYFIEESLGENEMFEEIAGRYTIRFPEENPKRASIVKNYLIGSWGSFKSKDKEEFDKYTIIMEEIKEEIENKEFDQEQIIKKVNFKDMII